MARIFGADAGQTKRGVAAGGAAGQVLAKVDGTDYNTEWVDASGGITDAPSDGGSYVRRNGVWVTTPSVLTYVKTSDQAVVSSTDFVDDLDMSSETLLANSVYLFEMILIFTAGTAEDLQHTITRTGLTDADLQVTFDLDTVTASVFTFDSVYTCAGAGVTSLRMGSYQGYLITGADTGSVTVQFRQQVAGTNPTTMRAGSMMMLTRVA